MTEHEAREWIKGERSMCNAIPGGEDWHIKVAQADAAMMQQAYWVLMSYKDGLMKAE